MTGRLVTILLGLLVGFAPLALGSNRPLPWAYNAVLAGAVTVLCCLVLWRERGSRRSLHLGTLALPLLLWVAALAWASFQLMPLGGSSLAHPAWGLASAALGEGLPATISVNAAETGQALMRLLTYTSVFLAAFVLARDAERGNLLLRMLLAAAALYALYGLLRVTTGIDKLLWFDQPHGALLTSTFINRNTAATYFGVASCVAFVFVLRSARHAIAEADSEATARGGLERLLGGFAGRLGVELALFVLLLTATLLTQSRAGSAATLLALGFGLLLHRLRAARKGGGGLVATLVVLLGLAAGVGVLQMSGAGVIDRMIDTEAGSENRFHVFSDTVTAIYDHAWMGTGLGTFQDIFPLYLSETKASAGIWDKAHNDYLEVLLGLGIPAGSAVILGLVGLVIRALRGTFERQRNSHMPMAGALAGLLVGVHAVFDFSLQIQAVAMTFALILGVAVAQSRSERS